MTRKVESKQKCMKLKGILFGLATAGVLVLGTSATRPADLSESGLKVGDVLPEMKPLQEQSYQLLPSGETKRYSLVHFWASYDGESRAENVSWHRYFARTVSDKIAYKAISLDPDTDVYAGTLKLDDVVRNDAEQCCLDKSAREEAIQRYGLSAKFHTYLVDDKGIVLSVDPTEEVLKQFYLL